jgi:hypothetical protein
MSVVVARTLHHYVPPYEKAVISRSQKRDTLPYNRIEGEFNFDHIGQTSRSIVILLLAREIHGDAAQRQPE